MAQCRRLRGLSVRVTVVVGEVTVRRSDKLGSPTSCGQLLDSKILIEQM
jgi:hypothetical protein